MAEEQDTEIRLPVLATESAIPSGDGTVWADVSPLLNAACNGLSLSLSKLAFIGFGVL